MRKLILITLLCITIILTLVTACSYRELPESPIVIQPTIALNNPTWNELLDFLSTDNTDAIKYRPYWYDYTPIGTELRHGFECYDYAWELQYNAHNAGWRCAIVTIQLDYDSPKHALNAFQTIDRGLIYIDDTAGMPSFLWEYGNHDKIADVQIGKEYIPQALFPQIGEHIYLSLGIVNSIELQWDLQF